MNTQPTDNPKNDAPPHHVFHVAARHPRHAAAPAPHPTPHIRRPTPAPNRSKAAWIAAALFFVALLAIGALPRVDKNRKLLADAPELLLRAVNADPTGLRQDAPNALRASLFMMMTTGPDDAQWGGFPRAGTLAPVFRVILYETAQRSRAPRRPKEQHECALTILKMKRTRCDGATF